MSSAGFHEALRVMRQLITALAAAVLFFPLTLLVPRKKNRFVVIGRESRYFLDNSKHFFIYLACHCPVAVETVFLTREQATFSLLCRAKLPAVLFPGWQALAALLTAEYIVVDNADWIDQGKYQLTAGAKIIQLWHGAPLKEIELPLARKRWQKLPPPLRFFLKIQTRVTGRYGCCEYLVSTSRFFEKNTFKSAFHARYIVNTGYPRNDAILDCASGMAADDPVWLNTDQQIIKQLRRIQSREKNIQTILYAPTFRKGLPSPFCRDIFDLARLDAFAGRNTLVFVIKLHPLQKVSTQKYTNILFYTPLADIYPALPLFDLLVTDYSSIYFDYLLLDRPIIFFPYDLQTYITEDRELLFEYEKMAPGPICQSQDELETALIKGGQEEYSTKRKTVCQLVFDHLDNGASTRLWQSITADRV